MNAPDYWYQVPQYPMPPGFVLIPQQQQQQQPAGSTHPLISWLADVGTTNFKDERIKNVINLLRAPPMDMSVADLLIHELKEDSGFAKARTRFFKSKLQIGALLNLISGNSHGRKHMEAWLRQNDIPVRLTCEDIDKEMEVVKEDMTLATKDLKASDIIDFDFKEQVTNVLKKKAPRLSSVLYRAAQSDRAARENTSKCPDLVCSTAFVQLCNSRSRLSIRFQHNFGLFLYATGTAKTTIEFLSSCGLSTSPSTIMQAHDALAESLLEKAAKVAEGPHMLAFDNEQISMSQHAAQRPGAEPMVRSFTATILYSLKNATFEACKLGPLLEHRKMAPVITYEGHVLPSRKEKASILGHLQRNIIGILFGGTEGFKAKEYAELVKHEAHRPPKENDITEEHILRTVEIDESRTTGCIELVNNVYADQMKVDLDKLLNLAIVCVNDQMTCSRLRSALRERVGDLNAFARMENFQIGPGFFHVLMNFIWHLLEIHSGSEDIPGSLAFYAKLLDIKRVVKDRPDYYTLRSFANNVLTANILHAWSLKTGFTDLNLYAESNPRPEDIQSTALNILQEFASESGLNAVNKSEVLLRNTILLNRDLLYFYELDNAISSGDFGRVELLLGILVRMFNGSGGKNYCIELLHLIQNLRESWTLEFADIMRDNLLISIQGHEDRYMGVDMNIEHNINHQKKYFTGKGVHGTAEHLARLSPATGLYRVLRKKFCSIGKIYSGSKHTDPSTLTHILKLRRKIEEGQLYETGIDRSGLTDGLTQTKDILIVGGESLQRSGMKTFEKKLRAYTGTDSGESGAQEEEINAEDVDTMDIDTVELE